jgi:segregation and condensation protein A
MQQLINIINEPNWKSMLYDLIKTNELDLWNINLITLTELYLEEIKTMQEQNLLVPANALLAATILLKLKAYSLKLSTIEDEEDELKLPINEELDLGKINLETPNRLKEGQISLEELINVVEVVMNKPTKKNIEKKIKEQKELNLTMPEKTTDIVERIEEFYKNIQENKDKENLVLFSRITNKTESSSVVENCFLPMLFLAMDRKIDVWQDDFFSEIFIKVI